MRPIGERNSRFLEWLTLLAAAVGVVATLSYATGAATILRASNPSLGAWWDTHQFHLMEGAATALGLLIGIRVGLHLVADAEARSRCVIVVFVLAILAFAPLLHVCSAVGRFGWRASSSATESRIIGYAGYSGGRQLDKVLIAGVYFLKTAGFAVLAGLALAAIAVVVSAALIGADEQRVQQDPADYSKS
jgi:hypothetical protein